ncbi:adenylylsulfate kinase [Desulfosporosinus sp. OT]|nr:adenylyl-sulfate kinase [Desulfosporosinus sp. OT]EGW37833.1 adenylylsulfate kinase [Desulfosporosinus sp. OT]
MTTILKLFTCGSVDGGKSILIESMLGKEKLITSNAKAGELDSKTGIHGEEINDSIASNDLLTEQEIVKNVTSRYYATASRSFIVADKLGREQSMSEIALGAFFADLAVIVVDGVQGVSEQTKRHLRICTLMGIQHVVLVVNKMDLIYYDFKRFGEIKQDFLNSTANCNLKSIVVIPVSATQGDNIIKPSNHMPWYEGLPLLPYLEEIDANSNPNSDSFIMLVQKVAKLKFNDSFRELQGQIESGTISVGDEVLTLPSNQKTNIKGIYTDSKKDQAVMGQAVTICLDKDVDVTRGCVLVKDANLQIADMFTATILWLDDTELVAGKSYHIRVGAKVVTATVMALKHKIDINTGNRISVNSLLSNELGVCDIALSENIVFDKFENNKALGTLSLIDKITNKTSALGVIEHSLRRSTNVVWQNTDITREIRAEQKGQKPLTLWFTGLSGSGKSTLANEVEKRLVTMGKHTMLLDGDNIRHGLNKNLGFKEADRIENIRRIAEVSKLMNDAGIITITSFISPYKDDRENAKRIIGECFVEIYVSTPLEECEKRDVKGLYKKARAGEIPNFTGISSPYEVPENPDIEIDTSKFSIEIATDIVIKQILRYSSEGLQFEHPYHGIVPFAKQNA